MGWEDVQRRWGLDIELVGDLLRWAWGIWELDCGYGDVTHVDFVCVYDYVFS